MEAFQGKENVYLIHHYTYNMEHSDRPKENEWIKGSYMRNGF